MPQPRQLLSTLLLLGLGVVTLGRTLRWPNDWAEAHWLLDYRFGFVKRGLLGQLLQWAVAPFGGEVGEGAIRAVSAAAFAAFVVLLGYTVWRVLRATAFAPGAVAVAAAFVASPFLVMTGHLVGYFDHVVFALGIVSIWLVLRRRPWAGALLQALAQRLRRTNEALADLVFSDVPGRVAKQLLDLADKFGQPGPDGVLVHHDLTQEELAQLVGASRETVNKALADFTQRGWVEVDQRQVLLIDMERLARRAR